VSSAIGASFVSSLPSTKNNTAANISKNKTKRTNGNSQAHLGCTCISQKLSNSKAIKELTWWVIKEISWLPHYYQRVIAATYTLTSSPIQQYKPSERVPCIDMIVLVGQGSKVEWMFINIPCSISMKVHIELGQHYTKHQHKQPFSSSAWTKSKALTSISIHQVCGIVHETLPSVRTPSVRTAFRIGNQLSQKRHVKGPSSSKAHHTQKAKT